MKYNSSEEYSPGCGDGVGMSGTERGLGTGCTGQIREEPKEDSRGPLFYPLLQARFDVPFGFCLFLLPSSLSRSREKLGNKTNHIPGFVNWCGLTNHLKP